MNVSRSLECMKVSHTVQRPRSTTVQLPRTTQCNFKEIYSATFRPRSIQCNFQETYSATYSTIQRIRISINILNINWLIQSAFSPNIVCIHIVSKARSAFRSASKSQEDYLLIKTLCSNGFFYTRRVCVLYRR